MKRIITCNDGTWNKPGCTDRGKPVETNVEKMFQCICAEGEDGIEQVKAYDQGVGTGYTWQDQLLGGATGAGMDKNIKDMYSFLVLNFQPGDEVYLFGFSRGAYTARSIGGFIRNCGILKPDYLHFVDRAYELYRDRNAYTSPDSDMMKAFRVNYAHETRIHFIGVWDTVGSLGIPLPWYKIRNMNRYKFHDVTLSSTVNFAYQALAIDERRFLFEPTLWQQSENVKKDDSNPQQMEQRWFSGVHSNVGGGYVDSGLSDIALNWLVEKARGAGLCFDAEKLKMIKPNCSGELRDSYTPMYWLWRPRLRTIHIGEESTKQTIDDTVWQRYDKDTAYRPKNIDSKWRTNTAPSQPSITLIEKKQNLPVDD